MKMRFLFFMIMVLSQGVCFAGSPWAPFNGFWVKGTCAEPEYTFYVAEGLFLYIYDNGARLTYPVEVHQSGREKGEKGDRYFVLLP
jgi:hypothetical protein